MKFNLKDYKDGSYAMHCATEEEAKSFLNVLHKAGRRWFNGLDYNKVTQWANYGEETIYYFNKGTYGTRSRAKRYAVLEWSDFMNKKFTKSDLKDGDIVLRRDGRTQIVCKETGALISPKGYDLLDCISENFKYIGDSVSSERFKYDIIAIRRPTKPYECQFSAFDNKYGDLVYEEIEEMTMEEICKALGKNIKIVKEKK